MGRSYITEWRGWDVSLISTEDPFLYRGRTAPNMSEGFISRMILSLMTPSEELDAATAKRLEATHQNSQALVQDWDRPSKTAGNMRQNVLSGRLKRGYNPVYYNDSVAVGTVASERNTIDTCIFWMEQEKLRQEGKPHVYVDENGEV